MAGVPYARAKLESRYDVIVIGSGIGGLACAALLSRQGKRVLVLERHTTAGGFTHTFSRQ
jgi:all-trans-retinol 13,14-reductase